MPTVSTREVSEVTALTAISGGDITDDAGSTITARGICWSTETDPTVTDSKTLDGAGGGTFSSTLTDLLPNNTYFIRAYATNANGTGYGMTLSFTTLEKAVAVDSDGNVYSTVVIGNQEWFTKNLRTTKYNDGTPIPNVTSSSDWSNLTSGSYAWYDNNEATYKDTYGALYNWYAVNTGNLCPTGWHVPTDVEWTTLTDYVGGASVAGTNLKATSGWNSGGNGTDEYGFSALPGGYRANYNGTFDLVGDVGLWWSNTENSARFAWYREMSHNNVTVLRDWEATKGFGFSVRCVRDI